MSLDGESQRRLCFEAATGLDHAYGRQTPEGWQAYLSWLRAHNLRQPAYAGSKGNLRPRDVRGALEQLIEEQVLPPFTRTEIDGEGYHLSLEWTEPGRVFVLALHGLLSRGGYPASWDVWVRSPDPPAAAGPVIVNAFLDPGKTATTLEEYVTRVRSHVRKMNLVLTYLGATSR